MHDVLNVFMCTGFTRDTHQYFMKASPVRPGDFIEFFAEIDLLGALSACPGGDCSSSHSDDVANCYPLKVEIYRPRPRARRLAPARPERLLARARAVGPPTLPPSAVGAGAVGRALPCSPPIMTGSGASRITMTGRCSSCCAWRGRKRG